MDSVRQIYPHIMQRLQRSDDLTKIAGDEALIHKAANDMAVMALLKWRLVPPRSVVGTSCLGAAVNNVVQVIVFTLLFSAAGVARGLMGGFLLLGTGVGFFTGLVAMAILSKVRLETAQPVD